MEVTMIIHIMYPNNHHDYIHARKLDGLISTKRIKAFLRYSEGRWIDIARDPIRKKEVPYIGPERRISHRNPLEMNA